MAQGGRLGRRYLGSTRIPTPCTGTASPLFHQKNDALHLCAVLRRHQHIARHLSDAEEALETIDHGQRREPYGYPTVRKPFRVTDSDLSQGGNTFDDGREVLVLRING